jgi:hypothetical protein
MDDDGVDARQAVLDAPDHHIRLLLVELHGMSDNQGVTWPNDHSRL